MAPLGAAQPAKCAERLRTDPNRASISARRGLCQRVPGPGARVAGRSDQRTFRPVPRERARGDDPEFDALRAGRFLARTEVSGCGSGCAFGTCRPRSRARVGSTSATGSVQFSRLSLSDVQREAWSSCHGWIDASFDCLTAKAFTRSRPASFRACLLCTWTRAARTHAVRNRGASIASRLGVRTTCNACRVGGALPRRSSMTRGGPFPTLCQWPCCSTGSVAPGPAEPRSEARARVTPARQFCWCFAHLEYETNACAGRLFQVTM